LKTVAGQAVVVGGRTIAQAERDHDLSWVVVAAAFSAQATALPPPESEPVTMLGIDETRARPKLHFAAGSPIRTWTDQPAKAA
jgi:transposase